MIRVGYHVTWDTSGGYIKLINSFTNHFHYGCLQDVACFSLCRCLDRVKENCEGCRISLLSPLLHQHTHFNLLEALKAKMPEISLQMDIQKLFHSFLIRFGFFDLPEEELVKIGQYFVRFSTPDAIYYGNYITKENECGIYCNVAEPEYMPTPIKQ